MTFTFRFITEIYGLQDESWDDEETTSEAARTIHQPFVNCRSSTLEAISRDETGYGRSRATRREGLAQ